MNKDYIDLLLMFAYLESPKNRRVTDEEMKKLEDHEKLYESKSRYTPTHKLSQRKM